MSRIDAIRDMLQDDPADAFLQYALALEFEKAGEPTRAIETLLALNKQQPDYLPVYYKLGKLYEPTNTAESIQYYRKGIEVARQQGDTKTLGELKEALMQWEDLD